MVACPNCHDEMTPKSEDGFGAIARPIEIGCCAQCSLFWFDEAGSIRLLPKSVIDLFRYIGEAGKARRALAANFSCPRCDGALTLTHDLQHTTHFTYWRCGADRGQLITFNQFLAEKNFVREPSPAELARLRATIRQVNCSQCGAPIDLATDSACTHCGAPVTLIDPDGVANALRDLAAHLPGALAADAQRTSDTLRDAQLDALFDEVRMQEREGAHDLLAIGAAAVGGLIGTWLLSRSST